MRVHQHSEPRERRGGARSHSALRLGRRGDAQEREADRLAGQPLRGEATRPSASGSDAPIQLNHSVTSMLQSERQGGAPLDAGLRRAFEPRLGEDLSGVRVHADRRAAALAAGLGARALTVGEDLFFGAGQYAPESAPGRRLLAHELAHVSQQRVGGERVQREELPTVTGGSTLRSPVVEELFVQLNTVATGLSGRPLGLRERQILAGVFGRSLDLDRVRIAESSILQYRTVGNVIRVPPGFDVRDEQSAQTLVHEATHCWQYQHGGTRYLSGSLVAQIGASIRSGSRNTAYDYRVGPRTSAFELGPEQQALMVENTFAMRRDRDADPRESYRGNHMSADGRFQSLTRDQRLAEIRRELPDHERMLAQLTAALPAPEVDLMLNRASEVMGAPGRLFESLPEERRLTPLRPLIELRF